MSCVFFIVGMASAAHATNTVKNKIVGMVQVRNEEPFIEQCLRALACYTDAIVILDDASTDNTVKIIRKLKKKLHIERIIINSESAWQTKNENYNRQRLLDAARAVGGTHFILKMDADQMFNWQCSKDNWLRKKIFSLKKGQLMRLPEINLWSSIDYYRDDEFYGPVGTHWSHRPFILCDDGYCNYNSNKPGSQAGVIHGSVVPANRKTAKGVPMNVDYTDLEHGVLHFKCVNLDDIYSKRVWYMCLELIRMNEKSDPTHYKENAIKLNEHYKTVEFAGLHPREKEKVKVARTRKKWFKYPFFDASIYKKSYDWRRPEVEKWFRRHGADYFADLDIWDLNWVKSVAKKTLPQRLQ